MESLAKLDQILHDLGSPAPSTQAPTASTTAAEPLQGGVPSQDSNPQAELKALGQKLGELKKGARVGLGLWS